MKKAIIFFACTVILAVAYSFAPTRSSHHRIKVISFNIRNSSAWSTQHDGINCWANRRAAVASMIAQEQPDAIGLQEVLNDQLHFLDSALVDYERIGVGRDDGDTNGECMAVYFRKDRFLLEKSATYWLSETPTAVSRGWDAACKRTVTMVLLEDRETHYEWLYMNTHLDHVGAIARAESTRLLHRLAEEWAGDSIPVVIGGDMNSNLQDTIFRSFSEDGWVSVREMLAPEDTLPTYTGYGKEKASQIDHFFIRNLRPVSIKTLNGNYGVPYISDHYPVMMEFD